MSGEKVFRDSVHGYISIPGDWCRRLVDTPIFQRLRHIEQTSMRCLYPSARHDRFVHSLGVYHLGQKAFEHLCRNARNLIEELELSAGELDRLRASFLAACLLHDCAHAPFSHTFEKHYQQGKRLDDALAQAMAGDPSAHGDLPSVSAAPHEKASAILLLQEFKPDIEQLGGDPYLAARMIVGCEYRSDAGPKCQFRNALISLLTSKAIDVDKLDYITRDTWASGVNNISVDTDRLLSATTAVRYPTNTKKIRSSWVSGT